MARVTLQDVAREAAVSAASVDRVLNRRGGVSQRTIERVEAAVQRLGYAPDAIAARLARGHPYRFMMLLPEGRNTFMRGLAVSAEAARKRLERERVALEIRRVDVFNGPELGSTLEALEPLELDGIIVVALDHPAVREAINRLSASGKAVVTLVSDVPGSSRLHYVGFDNVAAGRTAGSLLGRFLGGGFAGMRAGKVGVIAGSMALRDHAERVFGFGQVLAAEYPALTLLPVREGQDDFAQVEAMTRELLREAPDLVGIYNAGAGNRGIITALEVAQRQRDIVFIAHEMTEFTRRALITGTVDAVINQDAGHEVRSAVRVLMAYVEGMPLVPDQERIRIEILVRDNIG